MVELWFDRCSSANADRRHATLDGCHFKFYDFVGANHEVHRFVAARSLDVTFDLPT